MADTPLTPEEREALAAELALGVLDGEERAHALRLCLADPDFSPSMIDAWHRRLEPLYDAYGETPPPEGLWDGIARQVDSGGGLVLARLRAWRIGAVAALAVAASLALVLLLREPSVAPLRTPSTQVAVAQLVGAPNGPVVVALYDSVNATLSIRSVGLESGRLVPELWVIPADGKPRSLGFIAASGASQISVAPAHRIMMGDGSTLAVTLEVASTAPHAGPGGPPVAAGKIVRI